MFPTTSLIVFILFFVSSNMACSSREDLNPVNEYSIYCSEPGYYCSCNHIFTNYSQFEAEGDESKISHDYECGQFTDKCVATISFSYTNSTTHSVGVDVAGPLKYFNEMLDRITVKYSVSFGKSSTISNSMACHTNPGWKSWITMKPKYLRTKGHLSKSCRYMLLRTTWPSKPEVTNEPDVVIDTPIRRSNGDADGVIACRSAPIADVKDPKSTYKHEVMTADEEAQVDSDLEKLIKEMGTLRTKKTNNPVSGVYAEGICSPGLASSVCHGCLIYLHEIKFNSCNHSKGCSLTVKDCNIRYEFYPF